MGPISSKAKAKLDVNSKEFLGSGDKHVMYLNHFYQNNLEGEDDGKFETFKELICSN